MILFGVKIAGGWHGEPTMRPFDVRRERVGPKGGFTAIALWPWLIGVSTRMPNGQRWTRVRAEKQAAWDAMMDITDDYFAFEAATRGPEVYGEMPAQTQNPPNEG